MHMRGFTVVSTSYLQMTRTRQVHVDSPRLRICRFRLAVGLTAGDYNVLSIKYSAN